MNNKEVVKWTSGQLHVLLGYSDTNLSEYIISLATKCKTSSELSSKLIENDIPESNLSLAFAIELLAKLKKPEAKAIKSVVLTKME